ncbi:hypothetical protein JXL19_09605 [bacterium]|nr:hypothetical protein [bacterium]
MIRRIRNKIAGKISNIIRASVRKEMIELLPLIPQLLEFQSSLKEDRLSFYDHTKDPIGNLYFYKGLKDRLVDLGIPVETVDLDILEFEDWMDTFPTIRKYYEKKSDVFIEKCMEHYLTFRYLDISYNDIYIDVASAGSPWADILNTRSVNSYRLDISYPKGIHGINIGADAGNTNLPAGFATVLSLQCAFECFWGDTDILFIKEADRILNERGRYGIVPLYLEDIHFVSTSPYYDQSKIKIEKAAKKVWRDDGYRSPFSRHYSPESFSERIFSIIPNKMKGKILYFQNLDQVMKHYSGQRIYCFFMFKCEKMGK